MSPHRSRAPEVIDFDEHLRAWVSGLPARPRASALIAVLAIALCVVLASVVFADGRLDQLEAAFLIASATTAIALGRPVTEAVCGRRVGAWQEAVHPTGGVSEELVEAMSGTLADHGMILLRLKAVHPMTGPSRVLAAGADGREVYYRFTLDPGADLQLRREHCPGR